MTIISTCFLVLEILIIALGILIGYKRGVGRSVVRLIYLAVIGIVSFFTARAIAFKVSLPAFEAVYKFLPADIQHLFEKSHNLELLVENIVGAIIAPVIFAAMFGILQLLTLICFKRISQKLVAAITKKTDAPTIASKWIGAGVGLVASVAIAAVLLSPAYTAIHVIDNTSEETINVFMEALDKEIAGTNEVSFKPNNALKAQPLPGGFEIKPAFAVTKFHPVSNLVSETITTYKLPDVDAKESAAHVIPILIDITSDVLYVHNSTIYNGKEPIVALNNSIAAITPHLEESITVKDATANALCAIGEILTEDHHFMGIELVESKNVVVNVITNNVLDTMSHTTIDTVDSNMVMLFGTVGDDLMPEHKRNPEHDPALSPCEHDGTDGLLITMEDYKKNKDASPVEMIQTTMELFKNDPNVVNALNDMLADYIVSQIPPAVEIGKDAIKDFLENNNITIDQIKDLIGKGNSSSNNDNDKTTDPTDTDTQTPTLPDIDNMTDEEIKDAIGDADIDNIKDIITDPNSGITEDDVKDFLEDNNINLDDYGDILGSLFG